MRSALLKRTYPHSLRRPQVQPFLKWVGGKRQLLPEIRKYIPASFNRYFEPFIGGGAVLFDLQPMRATISDTNAELINLYTVIRDNPTALIQAAAKHQNEESYFYEVREQDRNGILAKLSPVERAARILYLNKTCYNGLFRVNRHGHFNAPFGSYANPKIADGAVIMAVSGYLRETDIEILHADFEATVSTAQAGDFVYFDPPYDPISQTASFTAYSGSFGKEQQLRLKNLCDALTKRGVQIVLSNSATAFIREIYTAPHYKIIEVEASRNINAISTSRGRISEFLIYNRLD